MSDGTRMSYRMGGMEAENVALKADVKRLEAEVARLRSTLEKIASKMSAHPGHPSDAVSIARAALAGEEKPLQKPGGGWAPGNYRNHCVTCGEWFMGDKRAVCCPGCAALAGEVVPR